MKMKLYAMMVIAMIAALQTQAALVARYEFNDTGTTVTNTQNPGTHTGTYVSPAGTDGATSSGVGPLDSNLAYYNSSSLSAGGVSIGSSLYDALRNKKTLTLTAWIKVPTLANSMRIIDVKDAAGFALYVTSSGTLKFNLGQGTAGGTTATVESSVMVTTGVWNFVAMTLNLTNANYVSFYSGDDDTNNPLVSSVGNGDIAAGKVIRNSAGFTTAIGNRTNFLDRSVGGWIDNVTFWNEDLTSTYINEEIRIPDLVPEPGSVLMVMVGAGVLFIVRRIRARA
jgi:hypothetical protein